MNRRNNLSVIIVTAALIVAGCKENQSGEAVQTVDWYKTHEKERKEMLEKCINNPGELAETPNCINAQQAKVTMPSDLNKSVIHPKPLEFK